MSHHFLIIFLSNKCAIIIITIFERVKYVIRKIEKNEIPHLYPYVHEIFSDMELPVLDELSDELLKKIVIEAMHQPRYRYGYENTWVCERNGQIAGVFFGYSSKWETLIDGPLQASMLNHGVPIDTIIQENESIPGEWYLDTLVTDPKFRRQGVAREMLNAASQIASDKGHQTIALNCETDNLPAYTLYQKMGYEPKTQIVLSGHVYWHMSKNI